MFNLLFFYLEGKMEQTMIITNNPKVNEKYHDSKTVKFLEGTYLDVLLAARNIVHKGGVLLIHPLSSSLKPNETPYKSLLVAQNKEEVDLKSIDLIENSIATAQKFGSHPKEMAIKKREDYKLIDLDLFDHVMDKI